MPELDDVRPVSGIPKGNSLMSPLRYPGGKRRLVKFLTEILHLNGLRPKLFVEPFAGGASVALQLLSNQRVEAIALGEKDELVASFWKVVFFDHEWLIEEIRDVSVTIDQWDYFRANTFETDRDRAMACLFLNRTSFSGVLARTAGPIGGRSQTSAYPIDCRFPVDTLVHRIEKISQFRDRVRFINFGDWPTTIDRVESLGIAERDVMYYMDPPFFRKAERLYRHYFTTQDHEALRDRLIVLKSPWVLSYDPAPEISEMYDQNGHAPSQVELLYSVSPARNQHRAQELIITNLAKTPEMTQLWSSGNGRISDHDGSHD